MIARPLLPVPAFGQAGPCRQGNAAKALDFLTPAYGWFTEGFETADLRAARQLIDTLRAAT
jgi:hypothetical protein